MNKDKNDLKSQTKLASNQEFGSDKPKEIPMWTCSIQDPLLVDEESFRTILDLIATEMEIEAVSKFLFYEDRKRALISLLLQRAIIQDTFGEIFVNPTQYHIQRSRENKPYLDKRSFPDDMRHHLAHWNYNASHHGSFVGVASSFNHLIGVDIVDVLTRSSFAKSSDEYIKMFRQQLTPYEIDYILQLGMCEEAQYQRFFIFWALKEAYIKAIGMGLGYDLLRVEFHLKADNWWEGEAEVWVDGRLRPDWNCQFHAIDHTSSNAPRHIMAIALGPLQEALPHYQDSVWYEPITPPEENIFPPLISRQMTVAELLDKINISIPTQHER